MALLVPTLAPPTLTEGPALHAFPEIHVALFLDSKNNAEMKETEVQLFSAFCCLIIHNPIGQLISLRRALPESSFVLHSLVEIQLLPISGVIGIFLPFSPLLFAG